MVEVRVAYLSAMFVPLGVGKYALPPDFSCAGVTYGIRCRACEYAVSCISPFRFDNAVVVMCHAGVAHTTSGHSTCWQEQALSVRYSNPSIESRCRIM